MKLLDRYTYALVLEQDLPNQIDFGRYCIIENNDSISDISYSNLTTNKVIRQEILLDKNKNLQDIFIDISIEIEKAGNDNFTVVPLIRRIKNKLGLNEFEILLYDKVFHLEEIFRAPHYLLEREIEKVHVSRAKRIPSKSYQYLASHTEDWVHRSIVSFKPSRILNEELELNFDIYENQITVALVERCLNYLNSRLKEIQDIKSFLSEYEKLLKNRNDQESWYKKINRNLNLIGSVYEDDHFHGNKKDGKTLSETEETLSQINKRLLLLRKSDLFDLVNKRATQAVTLRNTNVLVNHKHYRYVKTLWIDIDKVKPEKDETEKLKLAQDVMRGIRAYAKSLISYSLVQNLGYQLKGNYREFYCEHLQFDKIYFKETNKGIFEIKIGERAFKIVVVSNMPEISANLESILKKQHTFILYFDVSYNIESTRLIQINPLDPDSVERVGSLLSKYILVGYLDKIKKAYIYKQSLREFVKYIPTQYLEFDQHTYTYKFHSYPKTIHSLEEIKGGIETDSLFKSKSRPEREIVLNCINELMIEIEHNIGRLKDDYLNCFSCGKVLHSYNIERLDYIICPNCACLIDSSNSEKVILKVYDDGFNGLNKSEFGMDWVILNTKEL